MRTVTQLSNNKSTVLNRGRDQNFGISRAYSANTRRTFLD